MLLGGSRTIYWRYHPVGPRVDHIEDANTHPRTRFLLGAALLSTGLLAGAFGSGAANLVFAVLICVACAGRPGAGRP